MLSMIKRSPSGWILLPGGQALNMTADCQASLLLPLQHVKRLAVDAAENPSPAFSRDAP